MNVKEIISCSWYNFPLFEAALKKQLSLRTNLDSPITMRNAKNIAKSIKAKPSDIKAEVIIADLVERGFDFSKIIVKHDGLFKRNYSKDISDVYLDMVKDILVFNVSRDSLYDILPEGLFHHVFGNLEADNRNQEFEKLKQEEDNARKFFLPFDNEFFYQNIKLETELRKFFRNPDKQKYYISENKTEREIGDERFLKESTLGDSFICGDFPPEGKCIWEFSIILIDESAIMKYIEEENGVMFKLIEIFYEYFIPYEIEVKTKIICNNTVPFILGTSAGKEKDIHELSGSDNYLGYNSII
ncbi:MAG: hypothetical protein B6D61_14220 [Bacteroidetes bacterium 4484_249]|nr:MAG: hypothetical protein B6D61_14220 [Bacteroidetes bacterium 4484_249]